MKPVVQSRTGSNGTCFRACLASLLEVPERAVPDFKLANQDPGVDRFLAGRGLRYVETPVTAGSSPAPVGYHIITGTSPRGGAHAVVGKDGHLAWDPHPHDGTGRGLVREENYGLLLPVARATDAMRRPKPGEGARSGYPYDYVYKGYGLQKIDKADTDSGKGWVNIFGSDGMLIDAAPTLVDARWLVDQWATKKAMDVHWGPSDAVKRWKTYNEPPYKPGDHIRLENGRRAVVSKVTPAVDLFGDKEWHVSTTSGDVVIVPLKGK